jgi:hypothetical protein
MCCEGKRTANYIQHLAAKLKVLLKLAFKIEYERNFVCKQL